MSYVRPHMREDDADNDIDAASMTNSPTMAIPDSTHDHGTVPEGAAAGEPAPGEKIVSTTCVYVEYLPLDVTVEEVAHEFARCGELELDAQDKPRIKLYRYRDGGLKGDGLVNYKTAEGAAQAIENMDGRPLRMYSDDDDGDAMIVTMAFFEAKEKKQKPSYAESDYNSSQQRNKDSKSWGSPKDNNGRGAFGGNGGSKRYTGDDEPSMAAPAKSTKGGKSNGKPKPTVDEDGWETIVSTKPAAQTPAPVAEEPKAVASPPREPSEKPKTKPSLSVMTSSGSLVAAWGDDSTDEEEEEEEEEEEPIVIDDIEGIDDMTGDVTNDSDSEDEEVKEQRKQDAIAAKEQAAVSGGKSKTKKTNSKQSYSKKERKELKAKEDEEFERMLTQAVAEVNLSQPAKAEQSSNVSSTTSDAESATPPPEPAVLDKAAAAKAAKNKKRKEMAKRKKEEEAAAKTKAVAKLKTFDAGASSAASTTSKPQMSPAEVLALKKEKRAKKEAKAAKEKAELNAKKMAIQRKAKEQRAKTVANYDQTKREKFHFSSENSSGCDAG